ncbi:WD repeat-containing protein 18-like isoform X1 [Odontomachus brunneus]|uniref:WD repeat-containing protein 18-like isoform X1 n=2 Tax=Odontomachus brunneus TaxID=486640 RepID=UPI0013F1E668|nr:WD repeat-containing protein 18-like isoform X1 [Odontomachus brunneus]
MKRASDMKHEVILTSEASGESCSAAVWDPANGSLLCAYKNAGVLRHRTLQLLSDSYLLGADSSKPRIHVWSLNNPSPVRNLRLTTPGKVSALTCTPNGSYVISAVGERLLVWQSCNGLLVATLTGHLQTITCLCTTKDGSLFASAGEDGLVFVWSLYSALNDERCVSVHKFADHSLPVGDLHFGHGGTRARLYSVSLDRTVNIYELGSGIRLLSIVFNMPLTVIAVNIRDSELFVGCTTGDIFRCNLHEPPRGLEQHVKVGSDKDAEKNNVLFRAHKFHVTALSVSGDCLTLLSGDTDGAVHIWDIASRHVLRTIEHKGPITAAFFAQAFENFRATTLRPRLELRNLQQTSNGNNGTVEIISRGRDSAEILNFDSYVQGDMKEPIAREEIWSTKLKLMKAEVERLKKVNNDMYQYTLLNTLEKANNNKK